MKIILRLLLTTLAVLVISYLLNGVTVESFGAALLVAIVLGLLKITVRPILFILTLPITIITLGFFLLVINALVIMLADYFVTGFEVNGFWTAMLFSIILSIFQAILYKLIKSDKNSKRSKN